ncbi:MAG TPA: PIN domain-containing protein [Kiritimatiellia bacterium]|nr:PIN domain-containing protein [Kiritimatiellia bacterium]
MIALDTNLLIYAHRGAAPEHPAARRVIDEASSRDRWGLSLACVGEFYSVVTHSSTPQPSTARQASDFIEGLLEGGAEIWMPGPGFATRLIRLAELRNIRGPRIFDLQIALTAFEGGATELWSHDRNFVTVPGLPVVDPLA